MPRPLHETIVEVLAADLVLLWSSIKRTNPFTLIVIPPPVRPHISACAMLWLLLLCLFVPFRGEPKRTREPDGTC